MREILTIIACLLVALLTAALAGPWFIDWTEHRSLIEAQLAKTLGTRVVTRGGIDLKLLPTPSLELDGIEIDDGRGAMFRSQRVRLELSVTPLMRGEFRFIEASFDKPDIRLAAGADGAFLLPRTKVAIPDDVQFERITLTNGRLRIADAAGGVAVDIENLNLDAEAASLSGPFKGSGTFARAGSKVGFRFNTGVLDADRIRLKLVSDEGGGLPRADFDGLLIVSASAAGAQLSFEGAANFSGRAFAGWRLSGPLKLDMLGMSMDGLELRVGGDDAAIGLNGSGRVIFGADPRSQFTLTARQFDVDRLLSLQNAGAAELVSQPMRWINDADIAERLATRWSVAINTPALTVGGETLTDVAANVQLAPQAPVVLRFEGSGPGRSRLLLDGKLETGPAARFQGRVEASARDVSRLSEWVAQASPDAAARLRAIPFRAVDASGDMSLSAAGFSARDLTLNIDRSSLTGAAAFTRAIGAERARFYADMTGQALDLDALPDLAGPGSALANIDFSLGLDARAVRVARFGDGMIDAGRVRLRVARTGESIHLETLSLADIGGASVEAAGEASRDEARFAGKLDAQRLSDLTALLGRVAPGPWTEAFASRAVALSPARLNFNVTSARAAGAADFAIASLRLDGTARGTRIDATIKPEPDQRGVNGLVEIDSADAPQLVRQLGFEALSLAGAGRGRITAELRGGFDTGFETTVLAQIAGSQLSFNGSVGGSPNNPAVRGLTRVQSADAAPFMRLMTFGLPDISATLPLQLGARLNVANGLASIATISGSLAGGRISGDLAASVVEGGRVRVTGALALERLSGPALAALILGPQQAARANAVWPDARFGPALADTPLLSVDVTASQFDFADRVAGRDARLKISMAPGVLQLADFRAKLGEAEITGRLAMRRDGATAALSGAVAVTDLRIDQRALAGRLEGNLEFSSTGQNVAALVAGLAGAGKASVRGIVIPRADPAALSRVIALADAGQVHVSENDFIGALRRELDKAGFSVGDSDFEVTLATGVLRLANGGGLSGLLDLRSLSHEVRARLAASPLPKDWRGPAPQLEVVWKGPMSAPARELEAGSYVNALSARAIARESARIEALEADIRERAFFVRRERGLAFLRLREREVAAFEVEQARLAAEEERRRLAEAARLERDRIERERREAASRAAPPPIPPQTQAPVRQPVFPGPGVDPSAAGRY